MNKIISSLPDSSNSHEVFIIAEGGVNHNGTLKDALELVEAAKDAGCDAIKFQTWKTELVYDSKLSVTPEYQKRAMGVSKSEFQIIRDLELSWSDFRVIKKHAEKIGIIFFSTPDEKVSLDFLIELDVPIIKIASQDLTNDILIRQVLATGKPIILSTGASTLAEVAHAVELLENAPKLYLLHCVSAYPTPAVEANLSCISTLSAAFGRPIGFSDHTNGNATALIALGLGARIFEKHLTLDLEQKGPDHQASLIPTEMWDYCKHLREGVLSLGNGKKAILEIERDVRSAFMRFPVAGADIQKGELIKEGDVNLVKTSTGIPSKYWDLLFASKSNKLILKGSVLKWSDLIFEENSEF